MGLILAAFRSGSEKCDPVEEKMGDAYIRVQHMLEE